MKTPSLALSLTAAALMAAPWAAHADAFHGSTPSTMVGYAQTLGPRVMLRADLVAAPGIVRESIEEGSSHTGHIKSDRGALFIDWHVAGPLRLTGGMTFSRTRVDLRAGAHAGAPLLSDVPYSTALNDRFDVALRSPHTQPYVGVGYGLHAADGSSFAFDLGGAFRRAPSSEPAGAVVAAVSEQELAQLRDGIGRVRFTPQVSLGLNLRF
jgi:hypothetical protein